MMYDREMAEDAIDKIIQVSGLGKDRPVPVPPSNTLHIDLIGKEGYNENLAAILMLDCSNSINYNTACHLANAYGGNARKVLTINNTPPITTTTTNSYTNTANSNTTVTTTSNTIENKQNKQTVNRSLHPHKLIVKGYPYIEEEIIYAIRHEYAVRVEDIIARRTRLAFLNR